MTRRAVPPLPWIASNNRCDWIGKVPELLSSAPWMSKTGDRLDTWALAADLRVPITPLSDYSQDAPGAVRYFTETDQGAFSACTVFNGNRRTIVHNDAHP